MAAPVRSGRNHEYDRTHIDAGTGQIGAGPPEGPVQTQEASAPLTGAALMLADASTGPASVPALVHTGATGAASEDAPQRQPWDANSIPANYAIGAAGVILAENETRIAGPVWVAASTLDPVAGEHGLVVRWLDLYGKQRELAVTRDELHVHGGTLPARLARGGLYLNPGQERTLLRYLASFETRHLPLWQAATRVGWLEEPDGALAYMMPPPAGLISLSSHRPVIFQPERESPSTASLFARGTLDDWNNSVVALCRSNPLLFFALLVGLTGPLLRFAELESGGFHYYGRSSHGKTTAAQVAASVWGNGADPAEAPDRAFVQKWNSTANAFEALLSAHNDGLLVLDEIHTCDAKDFGAVVYNMAGGKGRQALDRDRQLRRNRKWRAMYFSTGEISVLRRLQADDKEVHAGQLLRLIDIPIDGGIITDTAGNPPATYADRIKGACARYFGVAGPALVQALVMDYEDARALTGTVKALVERNAEALTPTNAPPEHRRALKRFALVWVAGEFAIKLGVLRDCTRQQVEHAVRTAACAWANDGSNIPDRLRGVLNVQAFLERCESRFQKLGDDSGQIPRERAGFVGWDAPADGPVFLFTPVGFAEACGGQDTRETARELYSRRLLFARERDRFTEKRDIGTGRHRVYIVRTALLDFDPGTAPNVTGAIGAGGAPSADAAAATKNQS